MKILMAYIHYPVCSGRYMKAAFKRAGHDVKSVGYSTLNNIWGMKVSARHNHYSDGALDTVFPNWVPDVVVVMESAWAYHHPSYQGVPHVVYGVDNHVRDYRQARIDHYFLAHDSTSIMDVSADDVTVLPCGYDPEAFKASPFDFEERKFDVALVGVMYPERVQMVEMMRDAGLSVAAYTGLLYDEYAGVYRQARYALNISAAGDLNQRIFETAALGCVVLTHPIDDLETVDYPDGAIQFFGSADDAIDIAKQTPTVKTDTAWLDAHTWDARAKTIVSWVEDTYDLKPKGRKRATTKANA